MPTRVRAVLCIVIATLGFAVAMALRERFDPWRTTALAAGLAIPFAAWSLGPRLRPLLAIPPRAAAFAIALGIALVVATHLAYAAVERISPALAFTIRGLYASIDLGDSELVLTLLTAIVVIAEELVWRGAAFELLGRRSPRLIAACSVVLYALPQLASHAPLLLVAAVALGSLFAVQRHITGRITDALLTHAVWSCSVFVLFPLHPGAR